MTFVTIVATLCTINSVCVEEIVTDSAMDERVSIFSCIAGGQQGISDWMRQSPVYHAGWSLRGYKCVQGHYQIAGRA